MGLLSHPPRTRRLSTSFRNEAPCLIAVSAYPVSGFGRVIRSIEVCEENISSMNIDDGQQTTSAGARRRALNVGKALGTWTN